MDALIGLITVVGLASLVLAPPLVLRARYGAQWRCFALGIATWGAAVVVKFTASALIAVATPDTPAWAQGAWGGTLSAVTELGAAALVLRRRMRAADVLAFGAGIGSFEIVFKVLMGVAAAQGAEPAEAAATPGAAMSLIGLAEHASTVVGHTATRVLVYLARVHRRAVPAVIAFTTFSLVDGVAGYGWAAGWRWGELRVYGRVVAFLVAVACAEVVAARMFWRRLEGAGAAAGPPPP